MRSNLVRAIKHFERALSFGVIDWPRLPDNVKLMIVKQPELMSHYITMSRVNLELERLLRIATLLYNEWLTISKDTRKADIHTNKVTVREATKFLPALFAYADESCQCDVFLCYDLYKVDQNILGYYERILDEWDPLFNESKQKKKICNKRFKYLLSWDKYIPAWDKQYNKFPATIEHLSNQRRYEVLKQKELIRRRILAYCMECRVLEQQNDFANVGTGRVVERRFSVTFAIVKNLNVHTVVLDTDLTDQEIERDHIRSVLMRPQPMNLYSDKWYYAREYPPYGDTENAILYITTGAEEPHVTYYIDYKADWKEEDYKDVQLFLEKKANLFTRTPNYVAKKHVTVDIVQAPCPLDIPQDDSYKGYV